MGVDFSDYSTLSESQCIRWSKPVNYNNYDSKHDDPRGHFTPQH